MQCETFSIVRRRFINRRSVHGSESLDNEELVLLLLVSLISTARMLPRACCNAFGVFDSGF